MKKLVLIFVLMLIPCPAFGMQMLSNSSMDKITCQSGVSIAIDDVQVFINIDKLAYIDSDGINSVTNGPYFNTSYAGAKGGAIYLQNFQIDALNVNAIVGGSQDPQTGAWQFQTVAR